MLIWLVVLHIFNLVSNNRALPLTNLTKNTSHQDIHYRLSTDILPIHYAIDLKLEENAFSTNKFSGNVSITLQVISPVNEIKLHYNQIIIKELELKQSNNSLQNITHEYDKLTNILKIQSVANLSTTSRYIMTITYEGILSETAMNGFYKSSYLEDGIINYLATTDFEPTNARKAFPCFDEPKFKAVFDISIVFPKGYNALSNTKIISEEDVEGNLQKVKFETTPKMSTYLIAFIVSKLTCTEGTVVDKIPTHVCSRNGTQDTTKLAVSVAPRILELMEDYTGFKYAESNISKLTQVAIPDFDSGAMENWGLVTFKEIYLLWNEDESSNIYEEDIVSVVAHELSHQWFGNLVTLDWWSNVFLNEGFATYFEYYIPDILYPDWEFTKEFVIKQVQTALLADSTETSLPLSYYVETPDKISYRFDDISYNKGGSILRMVHYFLGLENFKKGLRDYIRENKFSNVNPTILWNSFEKYSKSLPKSQKLPDLMVKVMENWTNKSGYPLLNVVSDGNNIIISQERFLYNGSSDTKWYVPISYTLPNESFNNTSTRAWLTPNEYLIIPNILSNQSSWIILNNQQIGYFRINYNLELWHQIRKSLEKPNFDGIDVLSRAQIVDDLFNLVKANKKTYSEIFNFFSFLKNEESYYTWYSAFSGFSYVLKRTGDRNLTNSIMNYISTLMEKVYTSTPFNAEQSDNHIYTRKQILALTWGCNLGKKDCEESTKKLFADYKNQGNKPSRNLRSIVYCNGLRYSENINEDFDFLWSKFTETEISTEKVTILKALGCATDESVLIKYLYRSTMNDSIIRIQDADYVFSGIYSSSVEGIDIIFNWIINNYKGIVSHFGNTITLNSLISSVSDRFIHQEQLDKLKAFAESEELEDSIRNSAMEAVRNVQINLEVTKALETDLRDFFNNS